MNQTTNTISPRRLGFAVGLTWAVLHLGCILTLETVSKAQAATFFNTLLHGLDVTPLLRGPVTHLEAMLGILTTFILGWLGGATVAVFYNVTARRKGSP